MGPLKALVPQISQTEPYITIKTEISWFFDTNKTHHRNHHTLGPRLDGHAMKNDCINGEPWAKPKEDTPLEPLAGSLEPLLGRRFSHFVQNKENSGT
ncbi:hypothetical protein RJ639_002107 [Escallonia herrerae]|uniref:Uncharacterized protein n=1 Tax=Escallonia herrerae TaxID=1293975 RepID=A0AA89BJJ6_9ASTE|nr:hypothetical protein RJ639_002107 [Escallonia herrerae]